MIFLIYLAVYKDYILRNVLNNWGGGTFKIEMKVWC